MKVRKTQNIIFLYLSVVFIIFLIIALVTVRINNKKKEIFIQSNKIQLEESLNLAISQEKSRLFQAVFDYTFWDEIVEAVNEEDSSWILENIGPMISTFKIDIVWLISNDGRVLFCSDNNYGKLNNFRINSVFLDTLYTSRLLGTNLISPKGLMMVQGGTIHPTADPKRLTKPQGYLIIGKLVDKNFLDHLSKITGTNTELVDSMKFKNYGKDNNSIVLHLPISDYNGIVISHFQVLKNFEYLRQYSRFSSILMVLFFFSIVSIAIILVYITTRWINQPLKIVEEVLVTNDLNKAEELNKYGSEFIEIGNLIISFINQKSTLELLKNKAQESDKLKSAFLANMSHEIRTPLNGILGFSELLSRPEIRQEDSTTYKKIIRSCSNDLLRIIDDILDFSKIEAGQLTLEEHEFNVNRFIEGIYNQYANKGAISTQKGVEFKLQPGNAEIYIKTDQQRLKQIIVNLIDNAVKFTETGSIVLGFSVNNENCVIFVSDTGIGIPQDQQEYVFSRFHQVQKDNTKIYKGTGLGLSICKGLVQLMNGMIWLESKNEIGSTFYVSFPLTKLEEPAHEGQQMITTKIPNWKGKKLLLFEDNFLSSLLVHEYLNRTEIEIIHFHDAGSGIEYSLKHTFDIILMDIRLIGSKNGFEATRIIRQNHQSVPIIAQTAYAMDSDYTKAIENGCNDYITKPYDSHKLIQILMKHL